MSKSVFIASVLFFVTLIVLANYTVQFSINDWLTYGAFVYPLIFLLTDVLSEKYKKQEVMKSIRYAAFVAFIPTALMVDFRIAVASLGAFFIVQQVDVYIFCSLKQRFQSLWWVRINGSGLPSQLLDTVIFFTVAFAFTMPFENIAQLIIGDFMVKASLALLNNPLFYLIAIRKKL